MKTLFPGKGSPRTSSDTLQVADLVVTVLRKRIKNLYVRVYPPDGHVQVSAPLGVRDSTVSNLVLLRLEWIRDQQTRIRNQAPIAVASYEQGETHCFLGKRFRLKLIEGSGPRRVRILEGLVLELQARVGDTAQQRRLTLERWYRKRLGELIPERVAYWEPLMGVEVAEWRIRKMKTRWGTCNTRVRRIWVNLELASRPSECLEYVIVHEMVHLLERSHNARFWKLMDRFLPRWPESKSLLERWPNSGESSTQTLESGGLRDCR